MTSDLQDIPAGHSGFVQGSTYVMTPEESARLEAASLRTAAAEALLAGALLCAEVEGGKTAWQSGDKPNCVRLLKALEGLREALS